MVNHPLEGRDTEDPPALNNAGLPGQPGIATLLIADSGLDLLRQFRRNLVHAVRFLAVLGARLQNALYRLATSHEITIHTNVSATDHFSHLTVLV